MKRSMKGEPSSMFTARYGATLSHMPGRRLRRQSCKRSNLSRETGCVVAVRRVGRPLRSMRLTNSWKIIEEQIRFTPASMSWRRLAASMTVAVGLYKMKGLYVALAVLSMLVVSVKKSSGSDSNIVQSELCSWRGSVDKETLCGQR